VCQQTCIISDGNFAAEVSSPRRRPASVLETVLFTQMRRVDGNFQFGPSNGSSHRLPVLKTGLDVPFVEGEWLEIERGSFLK
jgi:hypothetical protein